MEVKLLELQLQNFKGLQDFTLKPDGQSVIVRGQNGTGKTTLLDAWLWLTTDKNSHGQSDFSLKTLDENNQPHSGLEHSVTARLDVNGREKTYSKVLSEEWRKSRKESRPTFRGHSVVYYVDGEKISKKKEWENALKEIAGEETLKLLTHDYFTRLHWKERRRILLSMAGDVSMDDVVKADSSLKDLPDLLGKADPEKKRKELDDRKKQVEKERDEIPPKIRELESSISEVHNLSRDTTAQSIEEYQDRINKMKQAGGEDPEVQKEWEELKEERSRLREEERNKRSQQLEQIDEETHRLNKEKRSAAESLEQRERKRENLDAEIQREERTYQQLRDEYKRVNAQEVEQDSCPWCGKVIEDEEKEELFQQAREEKAESLKDLTQKGKASRQKLDQLKGEREQLDQTEEEQTWKQTVDENEKEAARLEKLAQEIRSGQNRDFLPEGHDQRLEQIEERLTEIDQILGGDTPDTTELERALGEERAKLAKIDAAEDTKKRIEELKREEEAKNKQHEELSQSLYILDRYDEQRASLLEQKINSMFRLTRFRLFERKLNGGVAPDCEILFKGVPFSTGLNKGSRILVSLDINRTLAEFYGIWMPLFLDDKEGLTHEVEFPHQLVSLVATPGMARLKVETAET